MLTDAEMQVSPVRVSGEFLGGDGLRAEGLLALDQGVVGAGQVGGAAPELRQCGRGGLDGGFGRFAGRQALGVRLPGGEVLLPIGRQLARGETVQQRLALGVHHLAGLGLRLRTARPGAPTAAAVELGEHVERIGGGIETALLLAVVGAHLPGRTVTGQRILLIARDVVRIHALEEIIGLVVLADVIETEVPILARILAALRGAVRALVLATRPLAGHSLLAGLRLALRTHLGRLDANGVEEF